MINHYTEYTTYTLKPHEFEQFGVEEVYIKRDPATTNAIVINHPINGLPAGNRLRTHLNADHTGLVYYLTEDHKAREGMRLAEARRAHEYSRIQGTAGVLAAIGANLLEPERVDDATRELFSFMLEKIADENSRVRNPYKRRAVDEITAGLDLLEHEDTDRLEEAGRRIIVASEELGHRILQLDIQQATNRQKQEGLQFEDIVSKVAAAKLEQIAESNQSAKAKRDQSKPELLRRETRPGSSTANNGWYYSDKDPDWMITMVRAQRIYEQMHGELMRAMSVLAAMSIESMEAEPEPVVDYLSREFDALLKLNEISRIGGDYDPLADGRRGIIFEARDLLLTAKFGEAKKKAEKYQFFHIYRVMPRAEPKDPHPKPPEQFYVELPDVKLTTPEYVTPPEVEADFAHGLPGSNRRHAKS